MDLDHRDPPGAFFGGNIVTGSDDVLRIDNIEFAVTDIERARSFYGKVFGWRFKDYGPAYCEFTDGRLTGGFAKADEANPGGPLVILYADDLNDVRRTLEEAGAEITVPEFSFPGGKRFHFRDLEGYELAVWTTD